MEYNFSFGVGDVISLGLSGNVKQQFYKVVKQRFDDWSGTWMPTYQLIKCTSTGKEFKRGSNYTAQYVEKNAKFVCHTIVGVKASVDGIAVTKLKNRKNYLTDKMARYTKELKEIENKLSRI